MGIDLFAGLVSSTTIQLFIRIQNSRKNKEDLRYIFKKPHMTVDRFVASFVVRYVHSAYANNKNLSASSSQGMRNTALQFI